MFGKWAFQRLLESSPGEEIAGFRGSKRAIDTSGNIFKKIVGSTRTIKDPYKSLIDNMHRIVHEADRNEVMMAFMDLAKLDREMYEGAPVPISQVVRMASARDPNTIPVFVDGKKQHLQFQDDVYKSLKRLDEVAMNLPGLLTSYAKVVRWTVTNFPVFGARNFTRDFQNRLVISKNTPETGLLTMLSPKKMKEAQHQFAEALRLDPNSAKAHANLAGVLLQQMKLPEAELHYTEAIRLNPRYKNAHLRLSTILAAQGEFDRAKQHVSEVLRLDPGNKAARQIFERIEYLERSAK